MLRPVHAQTPWEYTDTDMCLQNWAGPCRHALTGCSSNRRQQACCSVSHEQLMDNRSTGEERGASKCRHEQVLQTLFSLLAVQAHARQLKPTVMEFAAMHMNALRMRDDTHGLGMRMQSNAAKFHAPSLRITVSLTFE